MLLADELASCVAAHVWQAAATKPEPGRRGCRLDHGIELDSLFKVLSLG